MRRTVMKRHAWWSALSFVAMTLLPIVASAQSGDASGSGSHSMQQVLETFRADSQAAEQRDTQRLETLLDDREALQQALADAEQRLQDAQGRRDQLESRQTEQQQQLAALQQQRTEEAGDIGDISGIVKQQASELRDALGESWLTVGGDAQLPPRLDDRGLIDLQTLDRVRQDLAGLIAESGRGVRFQAPVAGPDGDVAQRPVIRLGDTVAFSNGDLLQRIGDDGRLSVVTATPGDARQALQAFQQGEGNQIVVDPTDGDVLDALAQQPSLWERFQQGGYVGYVIVALGIIGLLVALIQYVYLLRVSGRMRRQMRAPMCLGERLFTRWDYSQILHEGLTDFIMPDVTWTGGISELKKIATMAETYYIPISPHNAQGPGQILGGAHVSMSTPNFYRLEHALDFKPAYDYFIQEQFNWQGNKLILNGKPGLGIDLDMDAVKGALHPDWVA